MVIVPDFNTSKVNLFYFGAKCAWKKVKLNLFLTTFEFSKYIRLDVVIEYMHICVRVGMWVCGGVCLHLIHCVCGSGFEGDC